MDRRRCAQIYNNFINIIADKEMMRRFGLSKRELSYLLNDQCAMEHFFSILQGRRCDPKQVLIVCINAMDRLCDTPEEGWLTAVYQYMIANMYPEQEREAISEEKRAACDLYIEALEFFLQLEFGRAEFDPMTDFTFLTANEYLQSANNGEYEQFLKCYRDLHVYALLRLGREATNFDLLSHVAGVHYVAMHAARSLAAAGIPVDLALVSGAAAGHDYGKFGCTGSEVKRIPYLHYYYTDRWFLLRDMPNIGHIAANHSTWDLELENLPVESLILIYADFRVKRRPSNTVKEQMHIYSLDESFDVILSKLDNVDQAKADRYRYVYAKLHDFQDYLLAIGMRPELEQDDLLPSKQVTPALLSESDAVDYWKHLAIDHNIRLMSRLNSETSFGTIMEAARSEKNHKAIRSYINIFEEYFTYLTQQQKVLTLDLLYELLMHNEGDIRKSAAVLIGRIIASYDIEYRKELPKNVAPEKVSITSISLWAEYLNCILAPTDTRITERHKGQIRYTLKMVFQSILENCKKDQRFEYLEVFFNAFKSDWEPAEAFVLLDTALYLPTDLCTSEDVALIMAFIEKYAPEASVELTLAGLKCLKFFHSSLDKEFECFKMTDRILTKIRHTDVTGVRFMLCQLDCIRSGKKENCATCKTSIYHDAKSITTIFLEDMKASTSWIIKEANIELLLKLLENADAGQILHVATHLSNLLQVSEKAVVRLAAGTALAKIAFMLPLDERNEIAIELLKGLETDKYEFSKSIPTYLGDFLTYLRPQELDELIWELELMIRSGSDHLTATALMTVGVVLQHYHEYWDRFEQDREEYEQRRVRLLGYLMCGLAHYHDAVSQEAFLVIARDLFGSKILSFEEKGLMFKIISKKMLLILTESPESDFMWFNRAASLNHIYRFISDYTFYFGQFEFPKKKDVAYFPGTFDPFSLSHKGMVKELHALGLEVYLALDEFSWSKNTQPRLVRRRIMNMSVSDMFNVYPFPDDIPVNILNPDDLEKLQQLFPEQKLYIAAGSDVIKNASSYRRNATPGSIHGFDHIIFNRQRDDGEDYISDELLNERIQGKVIQLTLPASLEKISSTRIRDNIDHGRDISNLIDPISQRYIFDCRLYLREPQYKPILRVDTISFRHCTNLTEEDLISLNGIFEKGMPESIRSDLLKSDRHVIISYDQNHGKQPTGFLCYHEIGTTNLFDEFHYQSIADFVRSQTSGKMVVITSAAVINSENPEDITHILFTEALAHCLKNEYIYALYADARGYTTAHVRDVLARQGFIRTPGEPGMPPVYSVDMRSPIALMHDVDTFIKRPLVNHPTVSAVLETARRKLQIAMTKLYPGSLVLSFHSKVMNSALIDKITALNGVPNKATTKKVTGEYMCVPYGKTLRGTAVPNTITKTLHVEKTFDRQSRRFKITQYPNYSPLLTQIRTIQSFGKPVLLVDDLLHKGYRLQELNPLFEETKLDIKKIVVGILSGRGRDLMAIQHREVESVYFIPNLRLWFSDATLYPYIGGDGIENEDRGETGFLPSINLLMPYAAPRFMQGCTEEQLYDFSLVCLQNAYDILTALEKAYRELFERSLTLDRLGEAIVSPRRPAKGSCVEYDGNVLPSIHIKNDIDQLIRLDKGVW